MKNTLLIQEKQLYDAKILNNFNKMMQNPQFKAQFNEFCVNEDSEENVLFLNDVEQYRCISKTRDRVIKQHETVLRYNNSQRYQLNVSNRVKQIEHPKIVSGYGQLDLFDDLENGRTMVNKKNHHSQI